MKDEKPDKETLQQWHDDPKNWKLSIFYYNPKDKRIFPPKRIESMGWTINFANPVSVIVALVLIVGMALVMKYVFHWN